MTGAGATWAATWVHERRIRTPNLDRLAREGTLFTQRRRNGSVCSPTRAALMTGRFPARLAMHGHPATPDLNAQRAMPDFLDSRGSHPPARPEGLQATPPATSASGTLGYAAGEGTAAGDYGFTAWRTDRRGGDWNVRQPGQTAPAPAGDHRRDDPLHRGAPGTELFFVNSWLMDPHATLNPTEEQLAPDDRLNPQGVSHKAAMAIYAARRPTRTATSAGC